MAKKIVLAGAVRTAIGKMGGALSTVPAVDLGSIVIKEALNETKDYIILYIYVYFINQNSKIAKKCK